MEEFFTVQLLLGDPGTEEDQLFFGFRLDREFLWNTRSREGGWEIEFSWGIVFYRGRCMESFVV